MAARRVGCLCWLLLYVPPPAGGPGLTGETCPLAAPEGQTKAEDESRTCDSGGIAR